MPLNQTKPELFVLKTNTWNHLAVYKQMINIQ